MASLTARIAAGVAIGLAAAISLPSLSSLEPASAEPTRRAPSNTGSPAGPAFLMDLSKGHDRKTQYLADYKMDEDWIKIVYRPNNIRFDKTGMTLELLKTDSPLPFSGSEFQRNGRYGYGRYEGVLKSSDAHGAVVSFFIYTGPYFGDPHDEIDFEFVGRTPRQVHLNYFRNGKDHSVNIPLGFDASQDYHLYAFEWSPDAIRWYVDGLKIREITPATEGPGIPSTSGIVMANLWAGAGGTTEWTGTPRFMLAKASMRCISHVPLGETGAQCSDTFKPPAR